MRVDVDRNSGFCGGVIRAINQAESFLQSNHSRTLYSLGSIVHNDAELDRLRGLGLVTIGHDEMGKEGMEGHTLLIRAHGEPPQTYEKAKSLGFEIVDCTCPVVLDLQRSISAASRNFRENNPDGQILIFGKIGHAEVLGLMGQAENAIVVENMAMVSELVENGTIVLTHPVEIFSQTTKNPQEYSEICGFLRERMSQNPELLTVHNTICTQVASRQAKLSEFASHHDIVIFVSGKASSNGKVLCSLCKNTNIRTYHIESEEELRSEWFSPEDNVGICGATSTPKWLLERVSAKVLEIGDNFPNFAAEK